MKILVTGAAGFIGSKLMQKLAERGDEIVGIDNINDYYDPRLKYGRLRECGIATDAPEMEWGSEIRSSTLPNCRFIRMAIDDKTALDRLMEREKFQKVVNMAAQAGVRYSITNPYAYLQSNIVGFLNVLEACRNYGVEHLIYASSSSVYGMNAKV
ncbi:MAG: NAD-dependent epimerase/dehydratase family protein, partial [Prevotella sp.]|nr:NAD-dependent epimerase/dehydratase family protein [Prevotella sp.]